MKPITGIGSKAWKLKASYHRRSLAEAAMCRIKTVFIPTLKSRTLPNQKTEAAITVNCLNRFGNAGERENQLKRGGRRESVSVGFYATTPT